MKYQALYNYTVKEGGATIRLADYPEKIVMPTVGYAVARGDEGMAIPNAVPEGSGTQLLFDDTVDRLLGYFDAKGYGYLGTWRHDNVIHVEPVEVFKNKDFAMGFATRGGEKAIYDLALKKEIFLKS